jgi:SAM-dependent methyltransferase
VADRNILEIACGHGRITRELARRGARVTGVDISGALIAKAEAAESTDLLGIRYLHADVTEGALPWAAEFDNAVCSFGLTDIDDLDSALANVSRALRPGGHFAFSILHPCFPGGQDVSGSWASNARYYEEGWWRAEGSQSTLRRQVGSNHRTLATYVNTLRRHGLRLDEVAEPEPAADWAATRGDAARFPVFLIANCIKEQQKR